MNHVPPIFIPGNFFSLKKRMIVCSERPSILAISADVKNSASSFLLMSSLVITIGFSLFVTISQYVRLVNICTTSQSISIQATLPSLHTVLSLLSLLYTNLHEPSRKKRPPCVLYRYRSTLERLG